MRRLFVFFIMLLPAVGMIACKKESAVLMQFSLNDYYPLQVGKCFFYRLDSIVYISFGTTRKVNSYIAKDSIVSMFKDNTGRNAYLVYRYLTDTLRQQAFNFSSSYCITPANNIIEVTDANNLHYIKLAAPVAAATTWKGNSYIDVTPNHLGYLTDWDYQYQQINMPFTVAKGTIDSTITVLQEDNDSPNEVLDPEQYQQYIHSLEVYAKGIGLIYKDFDYWTWQSVNSISPGFTDDSYGIKLSLIDYQ